MFTIHLRAQHQILNSVAQGKLTFVDLAGSERVDKSGSVENKQRFSGVIQFLQHVLAAISLGQTVFGYVSRASRALLSGEPVLHTSHIHAPAIVCHGDLIGAAQQEAFPRACCCRSSFWLAALLQPLSPSVVAIGHQFVDQMG